MMFIGGDKFVQGNFILFKQPSLLLEMHFDLIQCFPAIILQADFLYFSLSAAHDRASQL